MNSGSEIILIQSVNPKGTDLLLISKGINKI
ncbi:hypothetical protein SAMN05428947_101179 [Mucilaginibacter sp. OK283]|jgi:hypothetical protein|nr:hypothetical protein SAMN05428947_101179 [Mucilaginibacter sp. OK283]